MKESEKPDLRSRNTAEDESQDLVPLFPEIFTEGGKINSDHLPPEQLASPSLVVPVAGEALMCLAQLLDNN
jgi:hypothetical protein